MTQTVNRNWLNLRRQVMEKAFSRMNDKQKQAVFETEGPVLVLAGAGSGKTTVLVNRIANLVHFGCAYHSDLLNDAFDEHDVAACTAYLADKQIDNIDALPIKTRQKLAVSPCPPWQIMAITFTNKAAGELKERLCTMLGEDGQQIWACTFHSCCAKMLRRDAERIGYSQRFTIYDSDDSVRLMKECLRTLDISDKQLSPKIVLGEISRAKDWMKTPVEFEKESGGDFRRAQIAKAYALYQSRLADNDAMDFDDLLVNTVRLFRACPDVLAGYQNRFRYIMVDEYQDTNHAQYLFVKLIASGTNNLCVVGDDDQSIYKFRGATIENILNFEEDFAGAKSIKLEQNYRSTQNILSAANAVIGHNKGRKGKNLWTESGDGEKLRFHTAQNEEEEANWAAEQIREAVDGGQRFSDFAVLYRMNAQSLMFERMFIKHDIPYRIIGGHRFYERLEIKDMLAYLSVINNPRDLIRLRRIIARPRRKISEKTFDLVSDLVDRTGEDFFSILSHVQDFPELSKASTPLRAFYGMMNELFSMNADPKTGLTALLQAVLDKTGYFAFLRASEPEKAEDRIENVGELLSNIQRYESENPDLSLSDFLEEIALFTDLDNYDGQADAVVMMTIHSAKGLEFPNVFLPGWEEGVFPGASVLYYPEEAEEERRLAYVAITRARESLRISCAESRMVFGKTGRNRPSRFIGEIPSEYLERTFGSSSISSGWNLSGAEPSTAQPAGSSTRRQSVFTDAAQGFVKSVTRTSPSLPTAEIYRVGDTVMHKTFGEGKVIAATQMANDTLLEISFAKVGMKKLFANYARLVKTSEA